jgi:anti-sigma factor (TIGR02949 family)
MKQSCRDLEPLLTPYVDGEATTDQCAAVESHLLACPTCRDCADALVHVRQILHDCRSELREQAPPQLRARIAQLTAVARPPERAAWRRYAAPLSMAAMFLLLVAAGIFSYSAFSQRGTAFASQLAADHMRCMRLVSGQPPGDPAAQAAAWERSRGWTVPLPASSSSDDMQFVALRRCISADGSVAHALYRHQGQLVSLFIARQGGRREQVLQVMGQQACMWTQGRYSYAVIGAESPEEMARLVAWFRRRVGD